MNWCPERFLRTPVGAFVSGRLAELGMETGDAEIVGDRTSIDHALAKAAGLQPVGVLLGKSTCRNFDGVEDISPASSVAQSALKAGSINSVGACDAVGAT